MDISKLSDKQFALLWDKLAKKIKEDPIKNFIRAKGFMNFTPSPAQTVFLKIIFNQELDYTTIHDIYMEEVTDDEKFGLDTVQMTEVDLFKFMTGREYSKHIEVTKDVIVNMINLVIGRRGGKTTISAMLAIYCAIINNWKQFLQKTPFATVLVLSHSREFSDEKQVISPFILIVFDIF